MILIEKYILSKGNLFTSYSTINEKPYEWIICEHNIPKYYINIFNFSCPSNSRLLQLLISKNLDLEMVIKKIFRFYKIKIHGDGAFRKYLQNF